MKKKNLITYYWKIIPLTQTGWCLLFFSKFCFYLFYDKNLVLPYYWHSWCKWFYLISAILSSNPDLVTLKQHSRYFLLDFREELVQNITGFEEYAEPPTCRVHKTVGNFTAEHIPQFPDSKRNCKVCYRKDKKRTKSL